MNRVPTPRVASLRRRMVVATAVLTTLGMGALLFLVVVVLGHVVSEDIDGLLRARATIVLATVEPSGDTIRVRTTPDAALDNLAWVYDRSGTLVDGIAPPSALAPALDTLRGATQATEMEASGWRFRAIPIILDGGSDPSGAVVVGVDLAPYDTTEQRTLTVGIGLGLLVILGVSLMAAWLVRRALRPVAIMARRASEWSEEDLSRRFDLGEPRDELTQLGQVLDTLLSRVSRTILAEQRLTAELAHELRTPLTVVRAEAELASLDPAVSRADADRYARIIASVDHMAETITTLLSVARGQVSLDDRVPVDGILVMATAMTRASGPRVVVEPAPGLELGVPQSVAIRALAPLLDNAARFGRSVITVSAQSRGDVIEISVVDDGPGIGDSDPTELFAPGFHTADSSGSGLGLSLARRLARVAGGDVDVRMGARQTTFVLSLPRARAPRPTAPGSAAS
ncbi:HAMP domain-containing histidine kinase [Cryobacterium algoritolerans]|uniref:histidine kinase n=1 Tax=Cryobacterium algoritolerans TaxID=1259184 RepID=A0A4R8WJN6_9MICO|nr:HAMP domain-containing histidine kinase [Cryobacterium algoritolerans]